jgi:CRP-like cAMP-binding protein
MKHIPTPIDELSSIAPFDDVPVRRLRALAPHVDRLRLQPGEVLAREGERARELIVVLSGDVSRSRSGQRLAQHGAGSLIGGDAVVHHVSHEATWSAASDVEVLVVNGPAFRWASQVLLDSAAA